MVRNNFLRGWMFLAVFSLILIAVSGYFAFSTFPAFSASAALRPSVFIQPLIQKYFEPSAYVPFWTILAAALYSLISVIVIFYFFEKTQAPEVLFLSFFALSFSFEFARVLIPIVEMLSLPSIYSITAFRILLFGRYFGLFSLFAASIYAAGFDVQKQQMVFFLMVLAALLIAVNIPVDILIRDSTFIFWKGYSSMLLTIESGIYSVTIITFFISAYIRDSRTFIFIGMGVLMALAGKIILLHSDTWITPLPGLLLLAFGTWFACSKLHKIYLWL